MTKTDHTSAHEPATDASSELGDLDHKDSELIRLLAIGTSQVKAAEQLGITDRTIRRRKEDPVFRRLLSEARRELHVESWSTMMDLRDKAAQVLESALSSDDERMRLTAAKYVFDMGARIRKEQVSEEMLERVDALESRISAAEESEQ